MPITGWSIGIAPYEETWTETLDGVEDRMLDLAPMYDELYAAFRKIEQAKFDAEGPGWEALADATVEDREAHGYNGEHPILVRTGALRRSFTTKGDKDAVVEPLPDGLFMGSKHFTAIFHQEGTHGAGKDRDIDMVARPLVDMTQDDAELFAAIIQNWIFDPAVAVSDISPIESSGSAFTPVESAI